ncbi:MAG: Nramp family divalent metal transporter [bacterium]|nr:Nramp family divalent metal transporter [bacterium]
MTVFSRIKSKISPAWARMVLFLSIMGPGIITANVDNDAGGITTYSQAGAHFGLTTLWLFIPMTIALIMIQEMVNRMGIVSGKGLSDLIREHFGVRWTFYLMVGLLLTNFANIIAEFSGVAAAGELLGVPKWISVPIAAIFVWALVVAGTYATVEKVFLVATLFYAAYIITGFQVQPDWTEVGRSLVLPQITRERAYLLMMIGLIGTTIAPWMQFYQQASVVEKNISVKNLHLSRMDTIFGGITVSLVALFIVVVCAETLYPHAVRIDTADQAAKALVPLAGRFAATLFAVGLLNASLFAASILPISTSYTICEALGWESGVDRKFSEARQFYVLYTALIVVGAAVVMMPGVPLISVMFYSQVVNGIMLPFTLIPILLFASSKRLMGEHVNGRAYNIFCWAFVIAISLMSLMWLAMQFGGVE